MRSCTISASLEATTAFNVSRASACAAASSARAARSRARAASASQRRAASTSADAARREASRRTVASALRKRIASDWPATREARFRDAQEDGLVACGQRSGCRARRTGSARAAHAVTHPRRASAVASAMAAAPPGVAPAPASDSICSPFSKPDSGGGPAPPAAPPQAATAEAPGCGNGGACDHRAPCAPVTPCASACACSRPDGVSSPRALDAGDGAPSRIRSRCASCAHAEAPSAMLSSTARERARLVDASDDGPRRHSCLPLLALFTCSHCAAAVAARVLSTLCAAPHREAASRAVRASGCRHRPPGLPSAALRRFRAPWTR